MASAGKLRARLSQNPDDHEARLELATGLFGSGDREAAIDELLTLFKRDREWNEGAALVTYVGHGAINLWGAGPLFAASDALSLRNTGRLPFLLTPTCLDGFFLHPEQDSLAEQLLLKADGGIIGGVVPTGLSFPPNQRELAQRFVSVLFASPAPTVGEALMQAKQTMPSREPADREVIETFTLLGDPALRLVIQP